MANKWVKDSNLDASGRYKFTYTADKANSEYNYMILETENKFVDKNIFIQAVVPAGGLTPQDGSVTLNNQGATGLLGTAVNSAPSEGNYIMVSGSGAVKVGTAGWLAANSTTSSNTQTKYYPINSASFTTSGGDIICSTAGYVAANATVTSITAVSVSTSLATSGTDNYFTAGTSSDKDITITPQYTVSAGYVSATSNKNNGGIAYWKIKTTSATTAATTVSANGTTITQQASASWGTGWITSGTISAATFSATYTGGDNSYTDISNTDAAPALVAGSYLYINAGYTSKVKISLAKLIPDNASITGGANGTSNQMLKNTTAYDNAGNLITGTIESLAAHTYTPSTATQTITAGQYLSGAQTIEGDANLIASNIRYGATIFTVAGTFSHTSTITDSKTAVTAASLRSGYAAFINGQQINGTMATRTVSVTYTPTNITNYFTDLGTSASAGTYQVTIVPKYTVSAGYVSATSNKTGTTRYYAIKTATLSATAGTVTLQQETKAYSSTTPTLSIYDSSTTRNIMISNNVTTATIGINRVYIKIEGSGAVAASTTGWLDSTDSVSSTTATRYISMDYYTGTYTTG